MDVFGVTVGQECFRVDDFLDLSNDELFSASSEQHLVGTSVNSDSSRGDCGGLAADHSGPFTADDIGVPNDDVAQLEWLSTFVEESFTDHHTARLPSNTSSPHGRSRTKHFRSTSIINPSPVPPASEPMGPAEGSRRRCTHCHSEKTPQWRAGPMGPKTLCNACGVRYKSGRLVPEYRPAASPTFVLTQHSNSHRKVMELRRQKEMMIWQRQQQEEQQTHHQYYNHGQVRSANTSPTSPGEPT